MMAWMIIAMFIIIGFMIASWTQYCMTASNVLSQSETGPIDACTNYDYQAAMIATPVLFSLAAFIAVFFAIKCMMYPKKQMHDFSKSR